MPFKLMKVEMDGSVFMCVAGQPANINAFEVDPLEIWNSEHFRELHYQLDTEHYDAMCQGCPLIQPEVSELRSRVLGFTLSEGGVIDVEGQRVPSNGTVTGKVDVARRTGNTLKIAGWAADLSVRLPSNIVVAFVDGAACEAAVPAEIRTDVATHFSIPEIESCGFKLMVPLPNGATDPPVRIYALDANGSIAELLHPSGCLTSKTPPTFVSRETKFLGVLAAS